MIAYRTTYVVLLFKLVLFHKMETDSLLLLYSFHVHFIYRNLLEW